MSEEIISVRLYTQSAAVVDRLSAVLVVTDEDRAATLVALAHLLLNDLRRHPKMPLIDRLIADLDQLIPAINRIYLSCGDYFDERKAQEPHA